MTTAAEVVRDMRCIREGCKVGGRGGVQGRGEGRGWKVGGGEGCKVGGRGSVYGGRGGVQGRKQILNRGKNFQCIGRWE